MSVNDLANMHLNYDELHSRASVIYFAHVIIWMKNCDDVISDVKYLFFERHRGSKVFGAISKKIYIFGKRGC